MTRPTLLTSSARVGLSLLGNQPLIKRCACQERRPTQTPLLTNVVQLCEDPCRGSRVPNRIDVDAGRRVTGGNLYGAVVDVQDHGRLLVRAGLEDNIQCRQVGSD